MGAGENTGTDGRLLADHALHAIVLDMITRTQTVWPRCAPHATCGLSRHARLPFLLRCAASHYLMEIKPTQALSPRPSALVASVCCSLRC